MTTEPDELEMTQLGLCMYLGQRVEFALYGIAAHLSHLPELQGDRRLRDLDPEVFLRGDVLQLKVTLGQLVELIGDRLLLKTPGLEKFVSDRNLLAHNYYRLFHGEINGTTRRSDGPVFMQDFIERALQWGQILQGLMNVLMTEAAKKEGRQAELESTVPDPAWTAAYYEHAALYMTQVPAERLVADGPAERGH